MAAAEAAANLAANMATIFWDRSSVVEQLALKN